MVQNLQKKERIFGIDLARCICAIIIIAFHYAAHTINEHKILYMTATSGWGDIAVTVFFAVSGASLYYNYPKIASLRVYFWKRWKSIFPMFYLCFLYFFVQNVFQYQKVLYGPEPISLLLTVFGIDGYFLYRIPNYYIIGEWFLGAIVLIYVLYPLILWCDERSSLIIPFVLIVGYFIMLGTDYFQIIPFRNLFVCLASFCAGIQIIKLWTNLQKNTKKILMGGGTSVFIALTFLPFPIGLGNASFILEQVHGIAFFIVLMGIGELTHRFIHANRFVTLIAKFSFPMFLLHHKIIMKVQGVYDPTDFPGEICILIFTVIFTILCAKVATIINETIMRSTVFYKIESWILKNFNKPYCKR